MASCLLRLDKLYTKIDVGISSLIRLASPSSFASPNSLASPSFSRLCQAYFPHCQTEPKPYFSRLVSLILPGASEFSCAGRL
jgi:hypothetical protein